uniref:Uncharacterized protein n=1 Tax=Timema genevievae TaxID=629358 RepID=A0A7R9PL01_TIMGE|nr:unnamed protein product [Timema genevievae]
MVFWTTWFLMTSRSTRPSNVGCAAQFASVRVAEWLCLVRMNKMFGWGQENALQRIPDSLIECYNTSTNKENLLPMNLQTLLSILRKVEDSEEGRNLNLLSLSTSILHRFKLDGIERNPKVLETSGVIPYSVSGIQFYKHKILLTKLIPQNNYKFPNETLTPIERCTLHLMLSKSIEKYQRGDEGTTCNKLSSSSLVSPFFRRKRQVEVESESGSGSGGLVGPTTSTGDSEVHDETSTSLTATEEYPGKEIDSEDVEEDVNSDNDDSSVLEIPDVVNRQTTTSVLSDCPVENGVIHTKWGAVSISSVIAGIVSGLETQTVSLENLVFENDRANSLQEAIAAAAQGVDNRWSATISGCHNSIYFESGQSGLRLIDTDNIFGLSIVLVLGGHRHSPGSRNRIRTRSWDPELDGCPISTSVTDYSNESAMVQRRAA